MVISCTDTLRRGLSGDTMEHFYKLQLSYGEAVMAEYFDGDIRSLTFRHFGELTRSAASVLRDRFGSARIGSFVALQMENSAHYFVAFWSLLMAGYKPVLLDINATPALIEHILAQTGAVGMVTNSLSVPDDVSVITPDELFQTPRYTSFRAHWADEYALCTSGTTASSKVYVFSGKSLRDQFAGAKSLCTGECKVLHDGLIKGLAFLPLHHVFGFYGMMVLFNLFGKTVVYMKDRAPQTIQDSCKRHKVTHILAVPLFWNNVAQGIVRKATLSNQEKRLNTVINLSLYTQRMMGSRGRRFLNSTLLDSVQENLLGTDIQCCISGGGHVLPETLRVINGVGYSFMSGFGMTECGITGVVTSDDLETKLSNSIGPAFYRAEYKILPQDPKKPETGELLIRGASMHIGRMVEGVLLPADVDEDGWLHSGDLARMDKNGRVWIEGRIKEVIIGESGENVYPDELEDAFVGLPGVDQFCVTGINRSGRTEEIALIVDMKGKEEDEGAIAALSDAVASAAASLPLHKRVRYLFVTLQPLPVVNGIKVQRGKLKKAIEDKAWKLLEVDVSGRRVSVSSEKATPKLAMTGVPGYDAVLAEVKKIFAEVLSLDVADISDEAHFIYDLGGDSLSSLDVFTKVEEKYAILISDNEYLSCANARDLATLVCAKKSGVDIDPAKPKQDTPVKPITRFEDSHEYKEFQKRLEGLKEVDNPYFVAFDSALTDTSLYEGRRVINYGSYNYICLSGHPDTIRAAQEAAEKYGTSASGSRLLAGEKPLHQQLEIEIAKWKHSEAALVLVGGHSTNVTFVGNFCTPRDLILYDALSHNSIIQGCQLSKGESKGFPHNDTRALESILKNNRNKYEKVLIVVEGAYSMDGDIAPIPEFVRIRKQYGCFLMVDEAHSSCVIGKTGGGVDEYFNLAPDDVDIKMGTLSKGLGTCGGYLAGSRALIDFLKLNVPGFVFSVGLSPVLAAATLEGLHVMQREPERVARLHQNIADFIEVAHDYGFDTCLAKETAIVPILIGSDADAFLLSKLLLQEGVFVPPAVYPAVPKNQARLRFCLTSDHNRAQTEQAMATLDRLCKEHGMKVPRKEWSTKQS